MALYMQFDYYSNNPLLRMNGISDLTSLDKFRIAVELHFSHTADSYYLEMSQVEYIDSSLISLVLETHLKMVHLSKKLIIVNPSHRVASVFIATGLDSILNLVDISLPDQEVYLNEAT